MICAICGGQCIEDNARIDGMMNVICDDCDDLIGV